MNSSGFQKIKILNFLLDLLVF